MPRISYLSHPAKIKFEYWSWYNSTVGPFKVEWSLYSLKYHQLRTMQRASLIKWARRSVKKRRGSLQPSSHLVDQLTSKPLGSRMGKGKGRKKERSRWISPGQSLLCFHNVTRQKAQIVKRFFKRSNLSLFLSNIHF